MSLTAGGLQRRLQVGEELRALRQQRGAQQARLQQQQQQQQQQLDNNIRGTLFILI